LWFLFLLWFLFFLGFLFLLWFVCGNCSDWLLSNGSGLNRWLSFRSSLFFGWFLCLWWLFGSCYWFGSRLFCFGGDWLGTSCSGLLCFNWLGGFGLGLLWCFSFNWSSHGFRLCLSWSLGSGFNFRWSLDSFRLCDFLDCDWFLWLGLSDLGDWLLWFLCRCLSLCFLTSSGGYLCHWLSLFRGFCDSTCWLFHWFLLRFFFWLFLRLVTLWSCSRCQDWLGLLSDLFYRLRLLDLLLDRCSLSRLLLCGSWLLLHWLDFGLWGSRSDFDGLLWLGGRDLWSCFWLRFGLRNWLSNLSGCLLSRWCLSGDDFLLFDDLRLNSWYFLGHSLWLLLHLWLLNLWRGLGLGWLLLGWCFGDGLLNRGGSLSLDSNRGHGGLHLWFLWSLGLCSNDWSWDLLRWLNLFWHVSVTSWKCSVNGLWCCSGLWRACSASNHWVRLGGHFFLELGEEEG